MIIFKVQIFLWPANYQIRHKFQYILSQLVLIIKHQHMANGFTLKLRILSPITRTKATSKSIK